MQSILFNISIGVLLFIAWVATIILWAIAAAIGDVFGTIVGLLSGLIWLVVSVGLLIAVILCLVKAYQSQYYKLPIIGNFAEKFSAK
jgi:uncharacterized membrane protein